ncbi:MAG: hypothetical protein FJW20_24390 [Acidimicrobiia bacterium]|nr:hypothetical protein [Acidimicrobiia bacterium]
MRLLAIVAVAAVSLTAQTRSVGKGLHVFSLEKEAALGEVMARDLRRNATPLNSAATWGYIDSLGSKLAEHSPVEGHPYQFDVIVNVDTVANPTHEPAALPGGHIFVSAGLIAAAENEAELAGMIAHAMAHTAARHGTRTATRAQIAGLSTIPLIFMGGAMIPGRLKPIGFLQFSRGFELEADRLAVEMIAKAGYDPKALPAYIGRMQKDTEPKVFSPWPDREYRVTALEEAARKVAPHLR